MNVLYDNLHFLIHWKSICSRAQAGLGPGPGWGPYGPLWAHIWVLMGPYGPLWVLLGRSWKFRQISVRLLDQFRTFRVQKLDFDEISK